MRLGLARLVLLGPCGHAPEERGRQPPALDRRTNLAAKNTAVAVDVCGIDERLAEAYHARMANRTDFHGGHCSVSNVVGV